MGGLPSTCIVGVQWTRGFQRPRSFLLAVLYCGSKKELVDNLKTIVISGAGAFKEALCVGGNTSIRMSSVFDAFLRR